MYAHVHDVRKIRLASELLPVLADTVEDDYRRVDRITEYRKERRDDVGVDRDKEQRVDRKHNEQVVDQAADSRETGVELEPYPDIDQHKHDSDGDREYRFSGKRAADSRLYRGDLRVMRIRFGVFRQKRLFQSDLLFGMFIAVLGCYCGLKAPEGAEGVGIATTRSVVSAIIVIFIMNCFLSLILYK